MQAADAGAGSEQAIPGEDADQAQRKRGWWRRLIE
jgi:hypothetical protein